MMKATQISPARLHNPATGRAQSASALHIKSNGLGLKSSAAIGYKRKSSAILEKKGKRGRKSSEIEVVKSTKKPIGRISYG